MPTTDINQRDCFPCGRKFNFGEHQYHGKWLARYGFAACDICLLANEDGWAPHLEQKILDHLRHLDFSVPRRNAGGLLPRFHPIDPDTENS